MLFNDIIGIVFSTQPQQIGAKKRWFFKSRVIAMQPEITFILILSENILDKSSIQMHQLKANAQLEHMGEYMENICEYNF